MSQVFSPTSTHSFEPKTMNMAQITVMEGKSRAVVAHCGKTIMNTIMEEKAESTALIPYFYAVFGTLRPSFFVLFGSVSDTLASNDFGNPKSIPLVRGKPLKPLEKYEKMEVKNYA